MPVTEKDIWDLLEKEEKSLQRLPGEITALEYAEKYGIGRGAARDRLSKLCRDGKVEKRKVYGAGSLRPGVVYYRIKK